MGFPKSEELTEKPTFKTLFDRISDMKLFVAILFFQFDTLPPAPALHAAIDTFQARQLAATLEQFDLSKKGIWMNYVPAVGIGYTPAGEPRPTLSFSLSQVFTAARQRRDAAAARRSTAATAALASAEAHKRLNELLGKLELMKLELETMRQVSAIDKEIFKLAEMDYNEAKLGPNAFLPKQKAFLESKLALTRKEIEVRNFEAEILTFCNF
jgi:hypothetical protein